MSLYKQFWERTIRKKERKYLGWELQTEQVLPKQYGNLVIDLVSGYQTFELLDLFHRLFILAPPPTPNPLPPTEAW